MRKWRQSAFLGCLRASGRSIGAKLQEETMRTSVHCGAVAAAALLCVAGTTAGVFPARPEATAWAEGQLLVKFAPDAAVSVRANGPATTGLAAFDRAIARRGARAVVPIFATPPAYRVRAPGSVFQSHAGVWTDVPDLTRWYRVDFPPEIDEESVARELETLPDVEAAAPNHMPHAHDLPSDEYVQYQYAIHNTGQECPAVVWGSQIMEGGVADADLDLPEAWDLTTASDTVIVAVIDTGIDADHPDIAANLWINAEETPGDSLDNDENGYVDDVYGYNFRDDHGDPLDDDGHGTHVAGTISAVANNTIGVAGGAYNVKIMSCKFLSGGTSEDAAEAITYAVDNGARILNNSWGGPANPFVADAVDYAVAQGAIVFASAGNSGSTVPSSPVSLDNVVGVAATDKWDAKAGFSCYGDWVEMSAPGVNILSLRADSTDMFAEAAEPLVHIFPYPDGAYYLSCGTSMSCPYACAAAAMVASYHPGATYDEIVGRVLAGCDPIDEENKPFAGLLGAGRANVLNSLTITPAPHLIYASCEVDDSSGNGDGRLDPGETAALTVTLRNLWENAQSVSGVLSSPDPLVTVVSPVGFYGDIPTWAFGANELAPYVVELDPSHGTGEWIEFSLDLAATGRYAATVRFWVRTHMPELPGWPVAEPEGTNSSPAVGDIDGDGYPEVLAVDSGAGVYAYDRFGDALPGFPASFGPGLPSDGMAVGNIDGAGGDEVVVGTSSSKVYAFDGAGNVVAGWPATVGSRVSGTPALYDLDGNTDLEIIVACNDGKVYVFEHDGAPAPGWPREMDAGSGYNLVKAPPCVGDIDAAGTDVIIGSCVNGNVYIWNSDGTGYGSPDGLFAQTDTTNTRISPVMADVDGDGRLEIFIADDAGRVYAWNDDATALPGWPIDPGGAHNIFYQSPAVADVDGDGELEILLCSKECAVYAWEIDGSDVEGWPARASGDDPINSSPAVADLGSGLSAEVVACGPDPYVTAFTAGGSVAAGWPADIESRAHTAPVVADVDKDGDVEVIVTTAFTGLHVIDTDGVRVSGYGWWPTYRHDACRTGTMPVAEITSATELAHVELFPGVPNPFNPRVALAFALPSSGPVRLEIYDVSGRRVASLIDRPMDPGTHTAVWNGIDDAGHRVASGVYFVRLNACGQTRRTKAVLMR
jgi:subtilisin family serine protease